MNFDDYQNMKPFPNSADLNKYAQKIKSEISDTLTHRQYQDKLNEIDEWTKETYDRMRAEYYEEEAKMVEKFWQDVEKEAEISNYPLELRQVIRAKAWEDGHYAGFPEVYNKFQDVMEFVNKVVSAVKGSV